MFRNPVTDLIVVLVVALLIFGPKRLPMLGRSLGQGLREFKDSIGGNSRDDEERPELNAAAPTQAPTTAQAPAPAAAEAPRTQAAPPPPSPAAAPPHATPEPAAVPAHPAPPPREQESAEVASSERPA